ncbi:tetratricopeptide repeat protein, partial [bacterium]|nr:tetratricopeptide repeat protein [bacterium]
QRSDEIAPTSVRGGIALQPVDGATLAVDLDPRTARLGAEYQIAAPLSLRAGAQKDLDKSAAGWLYTLGFGLRYRFMRLDYAYERHPDLPATHHLAMAMAYNPALVSIKNALVRPSPVFKSFYRQYEEGDFIDVELKNAAPSPLPVTVSIDVPTLTKTPHEETVVLPPQTTQRYSFRLTFPPDLLTSEGAGYDNLVQPTVKVSYTRDRATKVTAKKLDNVYVLGKNKMSWSDPARAAAFVTPEDEAVDRFARQTIAAYNTLLTEKFGHNNIGKAAVIFDAVGAHGIRYQQDRATPYEKIAGDDSVFDTIAYPSELLTSKIGDCDDCTVLYASMLANLNIETALLDVNDPEFGHVYMMFDTGISQNRVADHFLDDKEFVNWEGKIWLPVETTLFGQSFSDAWRNGVEEYHKRKARGFIREVSFSEAAKTYRPGVVKPASIPPPDRAAVDRLLDRDVAFFDARVDQLALGAGGVSLDVSEGLYDAGAAYLRMNHLEKALDMFDRALEKDPNLADAYNAKGVVLTRRRQYDEALRLYQKALSLNPSDAGIRLNIALAYHLQGRQVEASQEYQRVLETNQEMAGQVASLFGKGAPAPSPAGSVDVVKQAAADNAYGEGASYLQLGSLDKAVEAFDRAVGLNPSLADAYNAKGVILTRRRQYDEALQLYQKALALNPSDAGIRLNIALTYHLQGRRDEALQEYRRVKEADPETAGRISSLFGEAPPASPSAPESGDLVKQMAADNAYNEGASYLQLNALDRAMAAFDRAIGLNPDLADAHNAKGVILTHRRQYDEALALYQRAIALAPENAGFRWNLMVLYHLQGKRAEAEAEYRKVVEIDKAYEGRADFLRESPAK